MVSTENLQSGRALQKQRTRNALLEAAARLVERGERPRLAAVAREAMVSRATAYRYFPSEEALILEAPLAKTFLEPKDVLPDEASRDPEVRVIQAQAYLLDHAAEHEAEFRTFLRVTFDQWLNAGGKLEGPLRAGRRVDLFDLALDPIRDTTDPETLRRLRVVLSVMSGIESLIAIRDVCRIPLEDGRACMSWGAQTLVRAVLNGDVAPSAD